MMRYLYLILLFSYWFNVNAQTKINRFCIVDADTKKPIPYASVSLSPANLAMSTEADGIVSIPGNLAVFKDTIFIRAQNYAPLTGHLRKLNGMDTIRMKKRPYEKPDVTASNTRLKDSALNAFDWRDVCYFAGTHTENGRFEYLQMAQEFDNPAIGSTLKKVTICRLAHILRYGDEGGTQYRYVDLEHTQFRLRIYEFDPKTGTPGRDLCGDIIDVKDVSTQNIVVDLREYNIVIPGKKFFVAIEWLRTFKNAGYAMQRSEKNMIFKPTLGILPYKTNKLNIWGLTYAHQWKPYTYYSPDWTDLAISPTLKW